MLLQDIYRLRYQVYCLECAFLPPDAGPGLETDDYDDCAIHVAAYTLEQALAGTVRLVQPREGQPYPFESHCQLFGHVAPPPRAQAAEVSRLVVRKTFRRDAGAPALACADVDQARRMVAKAVRHHARRGRHELLEAHAAGGDRGRGAQPAAGDQEPAGAHFLLGGGIDVAAVTGDESIVVECCAHGWPRL